MEVSVRSVSTLVGLLLSLLAVLFPITISIKNRQFRVDYRYFPFAVVVVLALTTCIPLNVILRGVLGAHAPLWAQDPDFHTNLVPLTVLIMFFSISYICLSSDASGLFRIVADQFAKIALKSKYPETIGLCLFFCFSAVFTYFTSNDIVVLALTPVILQFSKAIHSTSLLPYLLCQFVAANTFSSGLLSGNLSNFILCAMFNIDFNTYMKHMLLISLLSGLFILFYALTISCSNQKKKQSSTSTSLLADQETVVVQEEEKKLIFDKNCLFSACIILLMFVFFLLSSTIQSLWPAFEFWFIALFVRVIVLIKDILLSCWDHEFTVYSVVRRMPWNVPLFILSMFVFIESLAYYGVIADIALWIKNAIVIPCKGSVGMIPVVFFFLFLALLMVFVLNNLPAVILMTRLLSDSVLVESLGSSSTLVIYLVSFACNVGAGMMSHCSLAGLMYSTMIPDRQVMKSFWKHGFVLVLLLSCICLGLLVVQQYFFL